MDDKAKDILQEYRSSNAEGRLNIMMANFYVFPKMIRKMEMKTRYRIKSEREYLRSKARRELGVRVQKSDISKPTEEEAIANVTLEEAFKTGVIDTGILKGIEGASDYEANIRIISVMRMDFELLEEIIEDLNDEDSKWVKEYLGKEKQLKEIALDQGKTYIAVRRRYAKIREEIRDEILDCLEMNCRGGE
ncbi:MAG: hypothetical protein IJ526_08480 [Lachnospiraceae bacterium]|nr:hypothetical protein [Lachnospiraceae bacterium]